MKILYLIRHGEVKNPKKVIYGRLPGFSLSLTGKKQIIRLVDNFRMEPPHALYSSPMQRAQESAKIISTKLDLPISTDDRLIETGIGTFQGKPFNLLPQPYITEHGAHPQLESALSIRRRVLEYVDTLHKKHAGQVVAAVSHRDPIIVALLHWQNRPLDDLANFEFCPGTGFAIHFASNIKISRIEEITKQP